MISPKHPDWKSVGIVVAILSIQAVVVLSEVPRDDTDVILLLIGFCLPVACLVTALLLSPNKSLPQLIARMSTWRKFAVSTILLLLLAVGAAKGTARSTLGMAILIGSFLLLVWAVQRYVLNLAIRPGFAALWKWLKISKPEH